MLIVLGALAVVFFVGGYLAARRRRVSPEFERHLREVDAKLEQARAADRGWDRELLEGAARSALAEQRPGWEPEDLHLVLVDDRPGVTADRAEMIAEKGGERVHVSLVRDESGWSADRVE